MAKGVLDLANAMLKLVNTPIGQFVTEITVLGTAFLGLSSLVKISGIFSTLTSIIGNASSALSAFAAPMSKATAELISAGASGDIAATAFAEAGVAAEGATVGLSGLVSGLGVFIATLSILALTFGAVKAVSDTIEDSWKKDAEKANELQEQIIPLQDELAEFIRKHGTIANDDSWSEAEKSRYNELTGQLAQLNAELERYQKKAYSAWKMSHPASEEGEWITDYSGSYYQPYSYIEGQQKKLKRSYDELVQSWSDGKTTIKQQIVQLEQLKTAYEEDYEAVKLQRDVTGELDEESARFERYYLRLTSGIESRRSALESESQTVASTTQNLEDYNLTLTESGDVIDETGEKIEEGSDLWEAYRQNLAEAIAYWEDGKAFNELGEQILTVAQAQELGIEATEEAAISYDQLADGLNKAKEALSEFNTLLDEDPEDVAKGYHSVVESLNELSSAGKIGGEAWRTGLGLLFDAETVANFANADEAIQAVNASVFAAEDPAQALYQKLVDLADASGRIIDSSGKLIGTVDAQGEVFVTSYGDIAKAFGYTDESVKALFADLAQYQETIPVTAEQAQLLGNVLMQMGTDGINSMNDLVANAKSATPEFRQAVEQALRSMGADIGAEGSASAEAYVTAFLAGLAGLDTTGLLGEINGEVQGTTVDITANGEDAIQTATEVTTTVNNVPDSKKVIVTANNSQAVGAIRVVKNSLDGLSNKNVHISVTDASTVTRMQILNWYNALQNKTVTINFESTGDKAATGVKNYRGGPVLVNDGQPVNGSAAELIVDRGRAFVANDGKPTVLNLNKGATVYNARETQSILNGNQLSGIIPAFAGGFKGKPTINTPSNATIAIAPVSSTTEATSSTSGNISETAATIKANFETALREKQHYLAMDMITEEAYYNWLNRMNEKYFKNNTELQEEYWKYQEEYYQWQKQQLEDANSDAVELQNALNELAKTTTQRILVYKDGRFQYVRNADAIAKAASEVQSIRGYASGTTNAVGGISMVGENGPEMRVIGAGDGIIPSDLTNNLIELGSRWGDMRSVGSSYGDQFNINSVELRDVQDVKGLFTGLKNLALQTATKR